MFKLNRVILTFSFLGLLGLMGCNKGEVSKESLAKILKENPELIYDVIKANPLGFMETIQGAARQAQADMMKKQQAEKEKELESSFDNPLKPVIRKDEIIRGVKGAPITVVEYSDFECPYCTRGFKTVKDLMKKYKGKIQFVYKHLPLDFHKNAMIASQYYEGLRMQKHEMAIKFHDELYSNQAEIKKGGEKYLKSVAKKLGADMKKLAGDLKSKSVLARIEEDQKEAAKFNMQGTPGFIINGVPLRGAFPVEHFEKIVDKLKEKGKLTI